MKIRLKSDAKTLESMPCDRPLIIGRREGCELNVQDRSVSRQHAELAYRKNDGWYLRDLGSRFGTQVNGLPISAPIRLNEGDHITLGKLPFTVSLASDEDTGYNTTGVAVAVPPAAAPARPPSRPAVPTIPGQDTSPVARLSPDAGTRSRRRIVRIPLAASIDSTVKLVAVLGFASLVLIVVAVMLRGRGGTPLVKITQEVPQAPIDHGPAAPPAPAPAVAPAPATAGPEAHRPRPRPRRSGPAAPRRAGIRRLSPMLPRPLRRRPRRAA